MLGVFCNFCNRRHYEWLVSAPKLKNMSVGMSARSPEFVLGDHNGYSLEFFPQGNYNTCRNTIPFDKTSIFLSRFLILNYYYIFCQPWGMGNVNLPPVFFAPCCLFLHTPSDVPTSPKSNMDQHDVKFTLTIRENKQKFSCDLGFTQGSFNFYNEDRTVFFFSFFEFSNNILDPLKMSFSSIVF